jgi:Big-like domain-containing protein
MRWRHRHCHRLGLAVFAALAFAWTGCGGGSPSPRPVLTLIEVTPGFRSVILGKTLQFTATGTYSDGSSGDITTSVNWSSSNESMITIDSLGVATPHATGGVTITATLGEVSASTMLAVTPPASARLVWFTPDFASADMLDLFSHAEEWPKARASVNVFKFYTQQVFPDPNYCGPLCGQNIEENLASAGAFSKLNEWGLDIGFESFALKSWGCTPDITSSYQFNSIQAVHLNGGVVSYMAMDEPFIGGQQVVNGQSCNYTMEQSAAQTIKFIQIMHAFDPTLQIGDIEPYPQFTEPQLESWISALEAGGAALPFFHLDLDLYEASVEGFDAASDIQKLETFCESQGVAFGVIFIAQGPGLPSSDQDYYNRALQEVQTIKSSIGMPRHSIFQSWLPDLQSVYDIPVNLPENDPTIYSHTRLINDGLAAFGH